MGDRAVHYEGAACVRGYAEQTHCLIIQAIYVQETVGYIFFLLPHRSGIDLQTGKLRVKTGLQSCEDLVLRVALCSVLAVLPRHRARQLQAPLGPVPVLDLTRG